MRRLRLRMRRMRLEMEMEMMVKVERVIRMQVIMLGNRKVTRRRKSLLCGLAHQKAILI